MWVLGTYASLRLKLDSWSSAVQGGQRRQKCSSNSLPEGSLVKTRCLIKGPKSAIVPFPGPCSGPKSRTGPGVLAGSVPIFVAASHQTRLDTRSKARRPIKVGIKGRGKSGRSRDSNPACLCCSSAHLVQCEPDEASSFTNPNVGPGTYASLRLKLDAWSSAVQRGQKCSSRTRRLPSRSWGPIRPRVCSWFRAPIWHECQTAQLKSRGACQRALKRACLYDDSAVTHSSICVNIKFFDKNECSHKLFF